MRATTVLILLGLLGLAPLPTASGQGLMDFISGGSNKRTMQEELYGGDPLSKEKVALMSLDGIILSQKLPIGGSIDIVDNLRAQLAWAAKDPDLKGILLEVDSPGGGITASDILYKAVVDVRAKGKKVVVLMEDLAASGGYFVSAGADIIFAHPSTITGSIGVIIKIVNFEGLFEKVGLKDVSLHSSQTPLKDMLSSTRPMTEQEKKIMLSLLDQMYDHFVDIIVSSRKLPAEKVRKLADGRVYSAKEAKEAGLVDQIGFRDDALAALYKLCGLKKEPKLVKYRKNFNLQDFLSPSGSIAAPGQILERFLSKGSSPQFLYLWEPGQ